MQIVYASWMSSPVKSRSNRGRVANLKSSLFHGLLPDGKSWC